MGTVKDKITVTKQTPLHTTDWYIKWGATFFIIIGTVATAQNIYPYNLFLELIGLIGWLLVALIWNDRALIVVNAVGISIFLSGIFSYFFS
tara:strand:- start:315 stop:587 length:273 start_codon:yes stop_codon:yes gene_type:complete